MNILLRYTLAFALGIWLMGQVQWPIEWIGGGLGAVALGTLWMWRFFRSRFWMGVFTLLLFVNLGMLNRVLHQEQDNHLHLSHFSLSEIKAYQGYVLSLPETRTKVHKVELEISAIKTQHEWKKASSKVLLYIDKKAPKPNYGDELVILGTPTEILPPANPAQFDYQRFLSYQYIFFQDYLRITDFEKTGKSRTVWYKVWPYRLSAWSDAALRELIPYEREYGVAKAMVLGLRDEMDVDLLQAYSAAGAVHVLSVSGFHIGIFVWLLTLLLSRFKKNRFGKWLYLGLTLSILWFYAVLTGLSAPVIRSALMFTIFLLAEPLQRKQNIAHALFGSALVLLVLDPLLIYSVSFQLSYAALAGIIFLQPILYQSLVFKDWFLDKMWAITAVALTAQLATYPIAVYYFHQFPTYFLLANPLVVALSTAMLPVALAAILLSWIPLIGSALGWILTSIIWLLNQSVVLIDKLPFSLVPNLSFSWLELLLVYAIIGLLIVMLYERELKWLWAVAGVSTCLMVVQLAEIVEYRHQKAVVLHAVPYQTVVSLIDGQNAVIVADSAFFQQGKQPYDFYLKNFYVQRGIKHIIKEKLEAPSPRLGIIKTLPFGKLIVWNQKTILLVEQPLTEPLPNVDYVIVRKSSHKNMAQLQRSFGTQKLFFDHSNKFYVLDTLQKQVEMAKLDYHFMNKKGAILWHNGHTNKIPDLNAWY